MSKEHVLKVGDRVVVEGVLAEDDDSECPYRVEHASGGYSWHYKIDVKPAIEQSPIIFDPDDPRAEALIGKKVEAFDTMKELKNYYNVNKDILTGINPNESFPFRTRYSRYIFIRAIPENPVKKMTVAEVCDALGYTVEIVK